MARKTRCQIAFDNADISIKATPPQTFITAHSVAVKIYHSMYFGISFCRIADHLIILIFKTYRAKSWAEDFYDPWLVKHAELNWFRPNSSWGELMLTRERWVKIEESFLKWGNLYATANARQQQSLHSFTGMTAVINDELLVSWGEMIWHCRR